MNTWVGLFRFMSRRAGFPLPIKGAPPAGKPVMGSLT